MPTAFQEPCEQDLKSPEWDKPEERSIYKPKRFTEKRGLVIACEGLDGSGKTTIISRLRERLEDQGVRTIVSNWNDTTEIYNLMMSLNMSGDLTGQMRCLLGAVELAARYHYVILPALEENKVVFVTKYLISAKSHALVRKQDRQFVARLYDFALEPDITLYVDVPPAVALKRKTEQGRIGFWEAGVDLALDLPLEESLRKFQSGELSQEFLEQRFLEFQGGLRSFHKQLLGNSNMKYVDGTRPLETVVEESLGAVEPLIAKVLSS